MKPAKLKLRNGRSLEFGSRPLLMGIINCTPDSFSDAGVNSSPALALRSALEMFANGAAMVDVGGESTRPGAPEVPVNEEINRIAPVIEMLRRARPDCVISVDTRKLEVAQAALAAGADLINDVSGLQFAPGLASLAAKSGAALCLMHSRGTPDTMQSQENLRYGNVTKEVAQFLADAAAKALAAGVAQESIILDPGLGFAKGLKQNVELMRNISSFHELGYPLLAGPSRKSFLGTLAKEPDAESRDFATCGAATYLASKNVQVIRVHNVKAVRQALDVYMACSLDLAV